MWQVIGQPQTIALLEHSLSAGSLAHAYLFLGPPHVGKGTLALNLAQALNCEGDEPPCGQCQSCRRIAEGKYADVRVIALNSSGDSDSVKQQKQIGINDIKEIQHIASLPPYEGKYKVFIIDGAEYLSSEAANCLLKLLEEPPPRVVLLLLAVEEGRLLATIISRCQRIELKPISVKEVEKILVDSHGVDCEKARLIARLSEGCLGWALNVLIEDNLLSRRIQRIDKLVSLLSAGWEERLAYAAELAGQFDRSRKSADEMIRLWFVWWRDLLLAKSGCENAIINIDYELTLREGARGFSLVQIKDVLGNLQRAREQISKNVNPRLVFEVLMLSLPGKGEGCGVTGGLSIPRSSQYIDVQDNRCAF